MRTCDFTGCKREARWTARKLFGKGGTLCTCDQHKPGSKPPTSAALRAALASLRPFYDVKPLS